MIHTDWVQAAWVLDSTVKLQSLTEALIRWMTQTGFMDPPLDPSIGCRLPGC